MNFTCNAFFELVGKESIQCNSHGWDEMPDCKISSNVCLEKPQRINNAHPVFIQRTEFKIEHFKKEHAHAHKHEDRHRHVPVFESAYHHSVASFFCINGTKFADMKNAGSKTIKGVSYFYKNATCIGNEKWDGIPVCV